MSKKISLNPISAAILARRLPYALASILVPGLAVAGPTGGAVVAGQASIGAANGTTTINQVSHSAAINWQQFNVGNNEYVVFNQPSASATILNRVIGGSPSTILGSISSNGRVFLVNPQGIVFGQTARIDVGGLVASTMNIADQDFMSGRYIFTNGSNAEVSNAGTITTANNGFVVLAGDYVKNTGVIQAKLGDVVLASGSAMTLDLAGDGLINFSVDQAALSNRAGATNLGELAAQGGTVVMTAKVARALTNTAVNNSGQISAQGIEENGGDIYLTATGGNVVNSGAINASGQNSHNAGDVRINSDHDITLAAGSNIVATGADGGDVRVVAENHLAVEHGTDANVSRQSSTGKGGFVEYSGHKSVILRDIVHVGDYGKFLLDPANVTIGTDAGDTMTPDAVRDILNLKTKGSTFQINASSGAGTDAGDITFKSDIYAHTSDSSYGGNLELIAGPNGSITFASPAISLSMDGDITLTNGTTGGIVNVGSLDSSQGKITITSHGDVTTTDLNSATGIAITSDAGNIKFNNLTVTNTHNDSYVVLDNIDVNIEATAGSITGNSILIQNQSAAQASGMAAKLELTAGTTIDITGQDTNIGVSIGVNGGGGTGSGGGIDVVASADLKAGGAIKIAKNVAINGYEYDYPDDEESLHTGGAEFKASGSKFTADQDISVTGVGIATLDVAGDSGITIGGDSSASATATSLFIYPTDTSNSIDLKYGHATVVLTADENNSSAIPTTSVVKTGNIKATGPNTIVSVTGGSADIGKANNTARDLAISSDAHTYSSSTTIKDINDNALYSSNAGSALINIVTGGGNASNQGILTRGGLDATGPSAHINLLATKNVKIGGNIGATGSGYDQTGDVGSDFAPSSPALAAGQVSFGSFGATDAPFQLKSGEQATLHWGGANVLIAGASASGSTASAGTVNIDGNLSLSGVGEADAKINASQLTVGGDVSIFANEGTMSGTFVSQETIGNFVYNVTREIGDNNDDGIGGIANYGKGNLDIQLSSNTADSSIGGKIDVRGNSGSVGINGGHSFTVGSTAGSEIKVGGFRNVDEAYDVLPPVYVETVSYEKANSDSAAPDIASHTDSVSGDVNVFSVGKDTALTGAFNAGTNSITVEGTGVAGIIIKATSITATGQISVTGHEGSINYVPAVGEAVDTTFNDTILQLAPSGTAAASTGQIIVSGDGDLHVGGNMDAGAHQVSFITEQAIDSTIPGDLIAFSHPLDGGRFPLASANPYALGTLTVKTTDSIFFKFGAASALTGLSLTAGNDLTVQGDYALEGVANDLQVGSGPLLQGGIGGASITSVKLGATGTVNIKATGNGAGSNVTLTNSKVELASGAQTGTGLSVIALADKAVTVDSSTITAGSISLTSNGGDIAVKNSSSLIGGKVLLDGKGVGKNVSVLNSFISSTGGVTSGNGDLKIASAGSFTINQSTLSNLSGGAVFISSTGNAANSQITNSSALRFTGPLQITVSGTGSSLTIDDSSITPVVVTPTNPPPEGAALAEASPIALTPGNVTLKSSGNLTVDNSTVDANRLIIDAAGILDLGESTLTAGVTSLNGTLGVTDGGSEEGVELSANSLGVTSANGYIDFTYSILEVGNGSAKDVAGNLLGKDSLMLSRLGSFATTTASPNAAFVATGNGTDSLSGQVIIGDLTLSGDYLYVKGKSAGFGTLTHDSLSTNPQLFYNFVPRTDSTGVDASGIAAFINNFNNVAQGSVLGRATSTAPANLTVAYGSSSTSGPMVAGNSQNPINVSSTNTNLLFVTTGTVTGSETILTNGHVVLLNGTALTVDGVLQSPPQQPNVDPQAAQQAQEASKAASDVASDIQEKDKKSASGDESASDAANAQQDQIETHSNAGITDTSCI